MSDDARERGDVRYLLHSGQEPDVALSRVTAQLVENETLQVGIYIEAAVHPHILDETLINFEEVVSLSLYEAALLFVRPLCHGNQEKIL
jgi:hypothetical protein